MASVFQLRYSCGVSVMILFPSVSLFRFPRPRCEKDYHISRKWSRASEILCCDWTLQVFLTYRLAHFSVLFFTLLALVITAICTWSSSPIQSRQFQNTSLRGIWAPTEYVNLAVYSVSGRFVVQSSFLQKKFTSCDEISRTG